MRNFLQVRVRSQVQVSVEVSVPDPVRGERPGRRGYGPHPGEPGRQVPEEAVPDPEDGLGRVGGGDDAAGGQWVRGRTAGP